MTGAATAMAMAAPAISLAVSWDTPDSSAERVGCSRPDRRTRRLVPGGSWPYPGPVPDLAPSAGWQSWPRTGGWRGAGRWNELLVVIERHGDSAALGLSSAPPQVIG